MTLDTSFYDKISVPLILKFLKTLKMLGIKQKYIAEKDESEILR